MNIKRLKDIVDKTGIAKYINNFDDIVHMNNSTVVICTLKNNSKARFFLSDESGFVFLNVFGSSKVLISVDNKIIKPVMQLINTLLEDTADKLTIISRLTPYLKFYVSLTEHISSNSSYDLPPSYLPKLKNDIKLLIRSMVANNNHDYKDIFKNYTSLDFS